MPFTTEPNSTKLRLVGLNLFGQRQLTATHVVIVAGMTG
ncbi:hypothetical protein MNBD_GAMMA13-756 [hydrothermal vent metagenome]|uniref:Uncharacterized protein n=1 Tax=hydrothermal vent metagenome TaxID=652676 RepID=A0A3B0YD77_9ZZZZ